MRLADVKQPNDNKNIGADSLAVAFDCTASTNLKQTLMEIEIGKKYKYCGKKECTVLEKDKTHVLIQFNSGAILNTTHSALNPNYGKK